ncbi:MAG: hypothetical protein AB1847_00440 [bacterium]
MAKAKSMKKWAAMPAVTILSLIFFFLFPAICYSASPQLLCTMHTNDPRGPQVSCTYCHEDPYPGHLNDYANLADTGVCNQCHSPTGQFDGVNRSDTGAKANWLSGVYDENGKLKEGKEKWCVGCHDDGVCTILDVPAPNIAGLSEDGDWQSPAAIVAPSVAGADLLLDGDLETGSTGGGIIFDLGSSDVHVSHVRLYTSSATGETANWEIWGTNVPESSWDESSWTRILIGPDILLTAATWKTGEQENWNEIGLDNFIPVRYLKLVKKSPWPLSSRYLREFEFKRAVRYGYYVTGHKIGCDNCHDTGSTTASTHVDGVAQTYRASLNNHQIGYRLKSVEVNGEPVPPLEIPRTGCNSGDNPRTGNDFALCFACHDKYKLLGDAYGTDPLGTDEFDQYPLATNFRNDTHTDDSGNVSNEHLRHLRGRGYCGNGLDWDSDWDGTGDSPQSCPACHNIHGSPNPAMTRRGELASKTDTSEKSPMFNFQYLNAQGKRDPSLNVTRSTGGQTQFYAPGPGTVAKNKICNMCHCDLITYYRTDAVSPIAQCQDCHNNMSDTAIHGPSHATHLEADHRGPTIGCTICHSDCGPDAGSPHLKLFLDGKPLAQTTVCDPCHSKDGDFDGVNDPVIGAKVNWYDGVYQQPDRLVLKSSAENKLENWCATCHDAGTSVCSGITAPNVMGDNATYGYNITGHKIACSHCHDLTAVHTDGDSRSYSHNSDPSNSGDLHNYQNGYRLKYSMTIPLGAPDGSAEQRFALCFECHEYSNIMGSIEPYQTNFQDYDPATLNQINRHRSHVTAGAIAWDSDWDYLQVEADEALDSRMSCPACHNVHGAPNPVMIRHGELISTSGTKDKVPALSFRWYKDDGYTETIFGELSRYGDMPSLGGVGGGTLQESKVCIGCHGGSVLLKYDRDHDYQILQMPLTDSQGNGWVRPPLPPSMRVLNPAHGSEDIEVDHEVSFILLSNGVNALDLNTLSVSLDGTSSSSQTYEYGNSGIIVDEILLLSRQGCYMVTVHPSRFDDQERITVTVHVRDVVGNELTSPVWYFETGDSSSVIWRTPVAVRNESNYWYPDLLIDDNPLTGNPYSPFGSHWAVYDLGDTYEVGQFRVLIPSPQGRTWTISVSTAADPENFVAVKTNWYAEPVSVTVDNPEATFTGVWSVENTVIGYYGTNYQKATAAFEDTTATCTWTPQIPASGNYEVYARWTSAADRIDDATYTINYDGGSEDKVVDQKVNGGQWNLLGTYFFVQGTSGSIVLSNQTSSVDAGSLYVIADAVRLIPAGSLPAWVSTPVTPMYGRYLKLYTGFGPLPADTLRELDFAEPAP